MPPQQSDRLLDLVNEALDFRAHGYGSSGGDLAIPESLCNLVWLLILCLPIQPDVTYDVARSGLTSAATRGFMFRLIGTACGFAALSLLASLPARSETSPPQSIPDTLEAFGFFGRWAPDCSRPAALDNSRRVVMRTLGGGVSFTDSLGEKFVANTYVVLKATVTAPDTIVLQIELNDKIQQDLTMVSRNGKIRTMINKPLASDKPVVEGGVVLANGQKTPWLSRCGD
jgi:hypothetical protein